MRCSASVGIALLCIVSGALAESHIPIKAAAPKKPKQSRPADGDIALQLRWIVPCSDEAHSLPLRGDEAARNYCLAKNALADESDIDAASSYVDPSNQPTLRLTFTPEGSERLRRASGERAGEELGVLIDGELVFNVVVVEPFGHKAIITCIGLSREELSDWVRRLNAKARRRALRKST